MRCAAAILLAALAALGAAAGAAAAPPDDLSEDPIDRGALLALPSLYRVDVTLRVDALRTRDGRLVPIPPQGREIDERGTAFAVASLASRTWLVTAAHVAAPDDQTVARLAYQSKLANEGLPHPDDVAEGWVQANGATPVNARLTGFRIRPADAGQGAAAAADYVPDRIVPSAGADLALLRIKAAGAPALVLDESSSIGTPVAGLGFGTGSAFAEPGRGDLEPALRRGRLARTGTLEADGADEALERNAILTTIPFEAGDSGGPVIDAAGNVRGVAVIRISEGGVPGGIAERATEVRQLMEEAGVTPRPGRAAVQFRRAMQSFWDLELGAAERGFAATLAAFPEHTRARLQSRRARELAAADFALVGERRRQGFLYALGALAVLAAVACAVGLARAGRGRGTLRAPTERG